MQINRDFGYLLEIEADKLTIYATESRYPEAGYNVAEDEARGAIKITERVREFVLRRLNKNDA